MQVKRRNRRSDLKLLVRIPDYDGERFRIVFTAGKYDNAKYVCSYDGQEYKNCEMADKDHVLCKLDNHSLPCGLIVQELSVYLDDSQMPDGNFKINDRRLFEFEYEGEMYNLELTNDQSDDIDTPEIVMNIIGNVIKGKPFSYEDLTEEQKEQISKPALDAVDGKQDKLVSGVNIKTVNDQSLLGEGNINIEGGGYEPPVGGIPKEDLSEDVKESLNKADSALQTHQDISGKQDVIDDLESIRSGAALGNTSVQPEDISDMETRAHAEENYQAKGNYALVGASYTKGESDDRFITEHQDLSGKQDKLESGVNIKTINGFSLLGDGNIRIEGGDSSGGYTPPSDGIPKSDLADDVRESLSKADTALQEHQDISGKADKSVVDSISEELEGVKETAENAEAIARGKSSAMVFDIVENMVAWMSDAANKGKLKRGDNIYIEAQNLPDYWISAVLDEPNGEGLYYEYSELETEKVDLSEYVKNNALAEVAKSGNYNDLTNKPDIPSEVTDQTVSGWGFTKNTGDYTKPSGGIPKTDLDSGVQSSLGKADSALQSHQDISGKQDVIDDLEAIRSGARAGSAAVQPSAISDMETKTHASATYQPKGNYLTQHQSLAGYVTDAELATMQATVSAAIASFEERLPS